jgi:hypothetical protein
MWRRVDLVWTDVSEERIASIFRGGKSVSEEPVWTSVHTKSTRSHIPEGVILHPNTSPKQLINRLGIYMNMAQA